MENRESKSVAIALIAMLIFTTGCGITIIRNQHYTDPDHSVKRSNQHDAQITYPVDTLTIYKNGQN